MPFAIMMLHHFAFVYYVLYSTPLLLSAKKGFLPKSTPKDENMTTILSNYFFSLRACSVRWKAEKEKRNVV